MPPSPRTRPVRARSSGDAAACDPEPERYYLVIDRRFLAPVYVFLIEDPHGEPGFPGLEVRVITLAAGPPGELTPQAAIGGDPHRPDRFARFSSDGHARAAGFALIEPRYVGPTWAAYLTAFRPDGPPRDKKARPNLARARRFSARDAAHTAAPTN
jgi:hypothetical protein